MPEDAGDRFLRTVLADVNGTATDEEHDMLRADLETAQEWRAVLVRTLQDIEATFPKIKAEVDQKHTECLRRGNNARNRNEYFAFSARKNEERAGLLRQKAAIVEALKEAKAVCHSFQSDESEGGDRFGRIEKKLDRILALLEDE